MKPAASSWAEPETRGEVGGVEMLESLGSPPYSWQPEVRYVIEVRCNVKHWN